MDGQKKKILFLQGARLVDINVMLNGLSPLARWIAEVIETTDGDDDGAGRRRRRDGLRVVCVGDDCSSSNITGHEWQGDYGICSGDSGSPAIDGDHHVFGITSRGPKGCDDPVYGGLVGHRDWLVDAAGRAAKSAGIATPKWAADGVTAEDASELQAAGASCAASPTMSLAATIRSWRRPNAPIMPCWMP